MHTCQSLRAPGRLSSLTIGAALLFFSQVVLAGPAKPPLELLYADESRLISATLVEINPSGRLVFKSDKIFGTSKDVPEFVDAAVTTKALGAVTIGQNYIVGYTTFHHDKQYPAGLTPSRKGTSVISSSGLDPAMFVDSPELREILELAATERGRESSKLRTILLATFSEKNPALQRLAAGQFALDTAMSSKLSEKEKAILRVAAFDDRINPTTRSLLVTAASDRPDDFGGWAGEAINKVLEITPVDGYPDGAADPTGLVLLSFDEASARGFKIPFPSLNRWLYSKNQLYVERTTTLLESLYPDRRKLAFEAALAETDADSDSPTHQFLIRKMREVEQQDVVNDAQRH